MGHKEPPYPLDLEFSEQQHRRFLTSVLVLDTSDHTLGRLVVERVPEYVAPPAKLHVECSGGGTPAVTSAVAEISPNEVITSAAGNVARIWCTGTR